MAERKSWWGDFLAVRKMMLDELWSEGQTAEQIAATMSMDPTQVRLIVMTPDADIVRHLDNIQFVEAHEPGELVRIKKNGNIVIEITPEVVAHNVAHVHTDDDFEPLYIVDDVAGFVQDFVRELNDEEEDGTTLVHEMFDKAIERAIENGSVHLSDRVKKPEAE